MYSQFVAEDDFDAYLARMRRNGEVADHPEIQGKTSAALFFFSFSFFLSLLAMAELYGRPVVVYAADSGVVTTFHCGRDEPEKLEKSEKTDAVEKTDSVSLPPIRLLYINGDHYNSIVDIIRPSIGAGLGEPQLDRVANVGTEQMLVDRTLMLTELEQTEKTLIEAAAMEELQDEMLTQLRENDERTLISASLQQSEADSDRLLAAAIRDSAQDEDSLLQVFLRMFGEKTTFFSLCFFSQAALEASEQEMLQQMLQESQRSNWAPPNSNN